MMHNRYRTLVSICATAALILLLGACGSSDAEDTASGSDTRTVTDATGAKVEVPTNPQRVVTTHNAATQAVMDLGVDLAGIGQEEPNMVPKDRLDAIDEIPVVAPQGEVDVEAVAKVEPDLILVPNVTEDDLLSQLEKIAPVYQFTLRGSDRANWQQRVEEVADVLNAEDKLTDLQKQFRQRQEDLADEYGKVAKQHTIAVIGAYEANTFYAWGKDNMVGTILKPLGFTWSPSLEKAVSSEDEPERTVSLENLEKTVGDADVLLYDTDLRGKPNEFIKNVQDSPLYEKLQAVEKDQVYPFGKTTIAGFTDADYALDQAEKVLSDLS